MPDANDFTKARFASLVEPAKNAQVPLEEVKEVPKVKKHKVLFLDPDFTSLQEFE